MPQVSIADTLGIAYLERSMSYKVIVIGVSANILWKAKINLRKKLALVGICSLTAVVIIIAIIRIAIATSSTNMDLTWLILFGGIEESVGKHRALSLILSPRLN